MNPSEILTKEFLQKEYVELKKSIHTIARENGIASSNSVTQALYRFNIKREKLKNPEKLFTKEYLTEQYINQNKSIRTITYESGRKNKGTVVKYLKKHNIPLREYTYSDKVIENGNKLRKGYKEITGHYWYRIKRNAKMRSIEFDVTLEYLWDLFIKQNRKCILSGINIEFGNNKYNETTSSLDRIDNHIGYIEGNVQWVHKDINKMKQNLPEDRFKYLCKLITENNK